MRLITAGYGHGDRFGVWLSFRVADRFDAFMFVAYAMDYGCDVSFARKAASLLGTSGRYDCMVQQAWCNSRFNDLRVVMAAAGVTVVTDPDYFPPLTNMRI